MIAYQWDGMSRFPEVDETIGFFDEFYVFDKNDIESNSKSCLILQIFILIVIIIYLKTKLYMMSILLVLMIVEHKI